MPMQPDHVEQIPGAFQIALFLLGNLARLQHSAQDALPCLLRCAEQHVLHDRHAPRIERDLKGATQTGFGDDMWWPALDLLPLEEDPAAGRLEETGNDVGKRCLARSIRPDQPEYLPAFHSKRDLVERSEASELHADRSEEHTSELQSR